MTKDDKIKTVDSVPELPWTDEQRKTFLEQRAKRNLPGVIMPPGGTGSGPGPRLRPRPERPDTDSQSEQAGAIVLTKTPHTHPGRWSLMSRPAILRAFEHNEVLIDPFDQRQLGTNSYDIRLGEWYWREKTEFDRSWIYNPYSKASVLRAWKLHQAVRKLEYDPDFRAHMVGIGDLDRVIILDPGETVLAHTEEFIGSCCQSITCNMRGRSSTARNRIKICSDAGLGDVGYCNRWTMEITNLGKSRTVLAVGRRIGQMSFHRCEEVKETYIELGGKYQQTSDLNELRETWDPQSMLPRQWLDWETKSE